MKSTALKIMVLLAALLVLVLACRELPGMERRLEGGPPPPAGGLVTPAGASPPAVGAAAPRPSASSGPVAAATPAAGTAGQPQPIRSVTALRMIGPAAGWVGGEGWIARTGNGGSEWTLQYTGSGTVSAIYALDGERAWAVINGFVSAEKILRTTDGGARWEEAGAAPNGGYLHFTTPDTGFSGNAMTTDGGATWSGLPAPEHLVGDVYYADRKHGWAVTAHTADGAAAPDAFAIVRTTDGGLTWKNVMQRKTLTLTGAVIRSAGANDAWIECIGESGMNQTAYSLFHTEDGGATWRTVLDHSTAGAGAAPGFKNGEDRGIPSGPGAGPGMLFALNEKAAYMTGYCAPCDNAVSVGWTTDGGAGWSESAQTLPGYLPSQLTMRDMRHGWLATGSTDTPATLYSTDDGGKQWKRIFTFLSVDSAGGTIQGQSARPGGAQAEGLNRLDWQPAEVPAVKPWAGMPAGAAVVSQQTLDQLGEVAVTFFTLAGDENYVYADLKTPQGHFDLGAAGTYNYRKADDLHADAALLFSGWKLKITGSLGANATLSNYYSIGGTGQPAGVLRVDTGHAAERDVDRDGVNEAVSVYGLPMTAYVYRWQGGRPERADVNAALQADSVMLRDDMVFEATAGGSSEPQEFWLLPEGLIPAILPAD
ncbi:hypothetical protein [Paenibacillus sp. NFR01]|uniref:WD40/YVTN/BNR-like repeat-containing protein n=1 Tax=Paenibacillus sp. NFR01 TaxID=1566279 RepID=UPI0008CC3458|nr:hypothetical protein [Paenibacillus sp. NFR01]SEU25678.1 hypothetical protein SAMN03159358_4409 [Paenibacillus sp. NFR01]